MLGSLKTVLDRLPNASMLRVFERACGVGIQGFADWSSLEPWVRGYSLGFGIQPKAFGFGV